MRREDAREECSIPRDSLGGLPYDAALVHLAPFAANNIILDRILPVVTGGSRLLCRLTTAAMLDRCLIAGLIAWPRS